MGIKHKSQLLKSLLNLKLHIYTFQLISAHLRLLEDWHEDEEAADDEEDDREDDVHLDRSLKVGLFPPLMCH